MKRITTILIVLMCILSIKAQSVEDCEKIISEYVNAMNAHNPELFSEYNYSADFTFNGVAGEIGIMVTNMTFTNLEDTILSYEKLFDTKADDTLTMIYNFHLARLGDIPGTFVFNKENKLLSIEMFGQKNSTDVEIIKPEESVITIPFQLTGDNLIVVPAKLNGKPKNFILDTGANAICLDLSTANEIESLTGANQSEDVLGEEIGEVNVVQLDSLNLSGIEVRDMYVTSKDLSHLENGIHIDGIIGSFLINDYDLLFDYKNKTLTLIVPEYTDSFIAEKGYKYKQVPLAYDPSASHIPSVHAEINHDTLNLGIDCGAGANLIDIKFQDKFLPIMSKLKAIPLIGMDNDKETTVYKGKLKELMIGGTKFKSTETVFNDMSHFSVPIDGLIGYEILSKQKTILSYKDKRLIFIN